jgi:hypothetical protein
MEKDVLNYGFKVVTNLEDELYRKIVLTFHNSVDRSI